jgi:hypothetical protein
MATTSGCEAGLRLRSLSGEWLEELPGFQNLRGLLKQRDKDLEVFFSRKYRFGPSAKVLTLYNPISRYHNNSQWQT